MSCNNFSAAGARIRKQEVTMHIFESLKEFFMQLFSGKPPRPTAGKPETGAERTKIGSEGLENRCVNPDYGCPFEAS
jgi:hypothetical protein